MSTQPTQHHQAILRDLMDDGAAIAKSIRHTPTTTPDEAAHIALAFDRIARAIRRTILLAEKLAEPKSTQAAHRTDARKQIIRKVENSIHREVEPEDHQSLRAELLDRLDTPDADDDIDHRPIDQIIAEIRDDMGLGLLPFMDPKPRRTPEDIKRLYDHAAQRLITEATPQKPRLTHPRLKQRNQPPAQMLAMHLAGTKTGPPKR